MKRSTTRRSAAVRRPSTSSIRCADWLASSARARRRPSSVIPTRIRRPSERSVSRRISSSASIRSSNADVALRLSPSLFASVPADSRWELRQTSARMSDTRRPCRARAAAERCTETTRSNSTSFGSATIAAEDTASTATRRGHAGPGRLCAEATGRASISGPSTPAAEPLPADLLEPPRPVTTPPAIRTPRLLPIRELDWVDFERLCVRLAQHVDVPCAMCGSPAAVDKTRRVWICWGWRRMTATSFTRLGTSTY
jgi:hypothetical protein